MTTNEHIRRIVFIINGENVPIEIDDRWVLADARDLALIQSHNVGRPLDEWEVRDETGRTINTDMEVHDVCGPTTPFAIRLFVSLRVAAGGCYLCAA